MSMRLSGPERASIREVAFYMRESDFREFSATSAFDRRDQMADCLADRLHLRDDRVIVAHVDALPVAVGGLIDLRPNVLTLCFFARLEWQPIAKELTRWIRDTLFPQMRQAGVHRIEAVSMADHYAAHRWLGFLGLQPEGPPMRGYGRNGEPFQMFAWVDDACSFSNRERPARSPGNGQDADSRDAAAHPV